MSEENPVLELDPDPLVGSVLAERYRISKRLGEGGMGAVYLARHVVLEKLVALKILHPEYSNRGELVQRFLHEAKAASRIRHENVIDVYDFGQLPNGNVFFAMELLDGRDLALEISRGPLPWPRAKSIAIQICAALDAAHEVGVIHRDLKPENVFLMERAGNPDFVKVLDFGIAKLTELQGDGKRLTRTGMVFGTPEYMSPEQARGERPDRRVDVYACGCILYEMLTGTVPFLGENFMATLTKHIFDPIPKLGAAVLDEDLPAGVEPVFQRALAKDREQRFATMKELAVALDAIDGDATIPPGASAPVVKRAPSVRPARDARSDTPLPAPVPIVRETPVRSETSGPIELPHKPRWPYAAAGVALAALAVVAFLVFRSGKGERTAPDAPAPGLTAPTPPPANDPEPRAVAPPADPVPATDPTAVPAGAPEAHATKPDPRRRDPRTKPENKPTTSTETPTATTTVTPVATPVADSKPADPTPPEPTGTGTTTPTDGLQIKPTRDLKDPFPKNK